MTPIYTVTSPAPRPQWREILDSDPHALPTQTPEWLDAMCETSGFVDCGRMYETVGGRRLLLVMARRSRLLGRFSPDGSWPFDWGIGGVLSPDGIVTAADAEMIFQDLAGRSAIRTFLRPSPSSSSAFYAAAPSHAIPVSHMEQRVCLEGGFDRVWKERFRSSVRRAVRRAERCAVEVERDSTGALIPIFHELYQKSVDRWAQQQHEPRILARLRARYRDPIEKFGVVAQQLGERCTVWVARVDGRPAASIIVLRQGSTAKYWRGAMDRDLANPTRANDLLHSLAIEAACEAGCCWYNMGNARPGSTLARFKSGFGAEEQHYAAYWLERLPVSRLDAVARSTVKRVLRFRDA